MEIISRVENLIFRRQKFFLVSIVLLIFLSISFRFDSKGSSWLWAGRPYIPLFLVWLAMFIVYFWLRKVQGMMQDSMSKIRELQSSQDQISLLSRRQQEVFALIIEGKSNKEITRELHIELSTLKTHINQIYKILDIKSRKEAQGFTPSKK